MYLLKLYPNVYYTCVAFFILLTVVSCKADEEPVVELKDPVFRIEQINLDKGDTIKTETKLEISLFYDLHWSQPGNSPDEKNYFDQYEVKMWILDPFQKWIELKNFERFIDKKSSAKEVLIYDIGWLKDEGAQYWRPYYQLRFSLRYDWGGLLFTEELLLN